MDTSLEIKGIQDGLLVTLPNGEWLEARQNLLTSVREQADFFRGARLALQLHDRTLNAAELGSLRGDLAEQDVSLYAILSTSESTQAAAADLGMAVDLTREKSLEDDYEIPLTTDLTGEEAVLINRTLRSGHSIRHPGHVIVVGDVNPGAEIIAGGNIIIWGRLRGLVHAGAAGNDQSVVCALDLSPTQLRIAGQITVSPSRKGRPKPEIARIREDQLVAEEWVGKRKK
jgi:septum site-determining protein MinC